MNTIKKLIEKRMLKAGYSKHFAYKIFETSFENFFSNKSIPLKQKIWAIKRGFWSYKIKMFGLTEKNFRDYLSDLDYYKLHPINREFSHWIDDKLTMKLILEPFSTYLPEYYYHLRRGEVLKLSECPAGYNQDLESIIDLLKLKSSLAVKKCASSHGDGFIKLGYHQTHFTLNNETISEIKLRDQLKAWVNEQSIGYLITEFLIPCEAFRRIWEDTANTIRISLIREKHQPPKIIQAYIRFGTQQTGIVDNSTVGGITCIIDINTGRFSDGKIFKEKIQYDCFIHPDTQVKMEGFIPGWDLIKETILEIGKYLPHLIYMGFDVVVTDSGLKIIEINSHEGIAYNQMYLPYLKTDPTKTFFNQLLEEKEIQLKEQKNRRFFRRLFRFIKRKLTDK